MKIVKNINRVLLYYHIRGDINLDNFVYITKCENCCAENNNIGYNIYSDWRYSMISLQRNGLTYEFDDDINIDSLYEYLDNNSFISSKFNIHIGYGHMSDDTYTNYIYEHLYGKKLHLTYKDDNVLIPYLILND